MRIVVFAVLSTLLFSAVLRAQDSAAAEGSGCYDACALRVEGTRVLRGLSGQRVVALGMWKASPLAPYATISDSAAAYAGEFDRHYTPGTRWMTVGLVGSGIVGAIAGASGALTNDLSGRETVAYLTGLGISFAMFTYGERRVGRALRALSRAVWWTNRDLPR